MNGLALFAGIGGLELGLSLAIPDYRAVCYVERDAYAAATLVARMEDSALERAPIWDDVATFDGKPWSGTVDLISGGFPCQDISVAGKGGGLDGARSGLWAEYSRIIRDVEPGLVFVENVPALAARGLDRVLGDLASLGFDAEWDCFHACALGAPHPRRRMFVLAYSRRRSEDWLESRRAEWSRWTGPPDLGRTRETGAWSSEPPSLGVDERATSRVERCGAIGNSVVPAVAARAFLTLAQRLAP